MFICLSLNTFYSNCFETPHIIQVNEKLFPCQLSNKNVNLTEKAVQLAVETWGKRSLTELEAEERLSYACEKVNDKFYFLKTSKIFFDISLL